LLLVEEFEKIVFLGYKYNALTVWRFRFGEKEGGEA
jgi:hypothetical protein